MYDPNTGRFNGLDPFAGNLQNPQSLHKYAYVHGDPVNGVDPTGMMTLGGRLAVMGGLGTLAAISIVSYQHMARSGTSRFWETDSGQHVLASHALRQAVTAYFHEIRSENPQLFTATGYDGLERTLMDFLNARPDLDVRIDDRQTSAASWDQNANIMYLTSDNLSGNNMQDRTLVHEVIHAYLDYKYSYGNKYSARTDEGITHAVQDYHLFTYENFLLPAWRQYQEGNPKWSGKFDQYLEQKRHPGRHFFVAVAGTSRTIHWSGEIL